MMALVQCLDCGLLVSESAASCVSCGRPMPRDAAIQESDEATPSQWFLHAQGRRFGPLSAQEIRGYFTSGMVRAQDAVSGPGLPGTVSATEAAVLLQAPAPPPPPPPPPRIVVAAARFVGVPASANPVTGAASTTAGAVPTDATSSATASAEAVAAPTPMDASILPVVAPSPPIPPAPRPLAMTEVPRALGWHWVALWMVALFALQLALIPSHLLGANPSLGVFVGAALLRYVGTVATAFLGALVVGWLLFRELPGRVGTLGALTLVYAGLAGHFAWQSSTTVATTAATATEETTTRSAQDMVAVDPGVRAAVQPGHDAQPMASSRGTDPRPPVVVVALPRGYGEPTELPSRPGGNAGRRDWQGFAEVLTDRSDWTALVALARDWVRADPGSAAAWTYLGLALAQQGDTGQAIDANLQALRVDASYVTAQYNLANAYKTLGQDEQALAGYRRTLELKPDAISAYNNMAIVLSKLGRTEEAIAAWHRAAALKPGDARTWSNLGEQYYRLRQYPQAIESFRKALAIDPGYGSANAGLANAQEMQRLGR